VDEAHEQIAHLSAVQRLVEQGVLPMKHCTLQSLPADVMPRAELCRVGPIRSSNHRLPSMTDAA
jgi:hypothetical protein